MGSIRTSEEANEVTAVRLTDKRRFAKVGDYFRLSPHAGAVLWGRLIKTARFFGEDFEANPVYIYDAISSDPPKQEFLTPSNLIIGPSVVNNLGWVRGYWEIVASQPLRAADIREKHVFVRIPRCGIAGLFRSCWKWRRRSAIKVRRERNEEATEALFDGRESRHPEAAFAGQGARIEALLRAGAPAHGLLPLAEGVLRERGFAFEQKARPSLRVGRNTAWSTIYIVRPKEKVKLTGRTI